MTFQCKRCGVRWEAGDGFSTKTIYYTLCDVCAQQVLDELALGITKVEIQEARANK